MQSFIRLAILSTLAIYAAATNVITSITAGTTLTAGQPFVITWQPDTSSTVTLILRKGDASNLETIGAIASVSNTGSYTWYPSASLPSGSDYAVEILGSDGTPNYSHFFTLESSVSSASTSGSAVTGSTTAAIKTTTLPESLVTDSLISITMTSGNFSITSSVSSKSSASGSAASKSASRTASQSIASASAASSATAIVYDIVGRTGLTTLFALSLASMIFCMM